MECAFIDVGGNYKTILEESLAREEAMPSRFR
jgi:hypothetical protein